MAKSEPLDAGGRYLKAEALTDAAAHLRSAYAAIDRAMQTHGPPPDYGVGENGIRWVRRVLLEPIKEAAHQCEEEVQFLNNLNTHGPIPKPDEGWEGDTIL